MSEDLPHNRGFQYFQTTSNQDRLKILENLPTHRGLRPLRHRITAPLNGSEDLPHSSGIKTKNVAPQTSSNQRRKTCPTHLELQAFQTTSSQGRLKMSENLPHSSGIKTNLNWRIQGLVWSEDLPHSSGIKTTEHGTVRAESARRKTCPTNRGLRH